MCRDVGTAPVQLTKLLAVVLCTACSPTVRVLFSERVPARDGQSWSCHSSLLAWDRKDTTGCLAQDDLLYESLTVYETLYFAAMLRLPSSMTRAQKVARVADVIQSLGLGRCKDTIIGAPLSEEEASACLGGSVLPYCTCTERLQLFRVSECLLGLTGPVFAGGFDRRGVSGGEVRASLNRGGSELC